MRTAIFAVFLVFAVLGTQAGITDDLNKAKDWFLNKGSGALTTIIGTIAGLVSGTSGEINAEGVIISYEIKRCELSIGKRGWIKQILPTQKCKAIVYLKAYPQMRAEKTESSQSKALESAMKALFS